MSPAASPLSPAISPASLSLPPALVPGGQCADLVCLVFPSPCFHLHFPVSAAFADTPGTVFSAMCVVLPQESPGWGFQKSGRSDSARACCSVSLPERSATPQSSRTKRRVSLSRVLALQVQPAALLASVERSRACTRVSPGVAACSRAARLHDLSLLSCVCLLPH